ncbi:saposin B domain containing protein [Acanthamoeba castellanii str. Neff]|uniref:Saposin B domain containing protein n=1 Tax=Acanthamoeba castellanii (strain ATCC 30010 / Neff) TaxID=1257118 RepID=L8GWD6_ACACF|nr:saposin B domain containing protein [Acanthamoeba castellanii str. Neff]ELR17242.1 saposin B domain containing protein [Acanthamoeba castellanii str. Neff]
MKAIASLLTIAFLLCGFAAITPASAQETCPLCQFAVQYIDGYLQQNYTQAQIIKQLEVCDSFVEYYVPVLINYIIKYEDPQNACQQLGLCTSFAAEPEIVVADLEKFPEVVEVVEASPEDCQICKMLVGFIESYVQANQTITQIESLLGRVCRLTPFASQCVVFVDTYTPLIVQYIQANEDPQTVCQQIGVCSSQAVRQVAAVKFN